MFIGNAGMIMLRLPCPGYDEIDGKNSEVLENCESIE